MDGQVEFGGGVESVIGDVDRHSVVPQPFRDDLGQCAVVLDDENPHAATPALVVDWTDSVGSAP